MDNVVIVGAGPAGLALATELRRLGHAPRVLDKQAAGANTSRAAVIHAGTLEALEPMGVVPGLLAEGLEVGRFRVRDRDAVLMDIGFEVIPSRYNHVLMCPQDLTERHLLGRFNALGGQVERPVQAVEAVGARDHVLLTTGGPGGEATTTCRWLVGCDGGHSLVRGQAGIPFQGGRYEESFVLADVRMPWPIGRDEVSLFFSPEGLVVTAPLPGDLFRIVATVDQAPAEPPASLFEDLLRRRGPAGCGAIDAVVWSSRFRIQHRLAATPRRGRILLCGDAAHVHSPAGGQGMNTGIQDAVALAAALHAVLRGGPENLLDDWARDRHRIGREVIALTDRLTRMATLKGRAARGARNALLRGLGGLAPVQAAIAARLSEIRR